MKAPLRFFWMLAPALLLHAAFPLAWAQSGPEPEAAPEPVSGEPAAAPAAAPPKPEAARPKAGEPSGFVFSSPQKTSIYQDDQFKDEALIRITDRVSARSREITLKAGMTEAFDELLVTLTRCRATPLTEKPNDSALIEVRRAPPKTTNWESTDKEKPSPEQRPAVEPNPNDSADLPLLYKGWIFSESPGLSTLEHPVYTMRLLRCGQPPEPPKEDELPEGESAPVAGPEGETTDGKAEEFQGED